MSNLNTKIYHDLIGIFSFCLIHKIQSIDEILLLIKKVSNGDSVSETYFKELITCFLAFTKHNPLLFFHLKFFIQTNRAFTTGYFDGIGKRGELFVITTYLSFEKTQTHIQDHYCNYQKYFHYPAPKVYVLSLFAAQIEEFRS